MEKINFEGLGISLEINRIAVELGNLKIYWYALLIVTAFITSLILMKKDDGKYNIKFENILEIFLLVLPTAIICARIYFVIFKIDYYIKNPMEIFNIAQGGLAIYGGVIGSIIAIMIYCKIKKINTLDILDYIAPFLPLGQAIGRWGNFFNREAHGYETNSLFRMGIEENGKYIQVHPTFFYESISTFLLFIFLYKIRNKRKYEGQLTYMYFCFYGIIRAIIEQLRTDSLMVGNIRISQLLSIVMWIVFGTILIYKKIKRGENI